MSYAQRIIEAANTKVTATKKIVATDDYHKQLIALLKKASGVAPTVVDSDDSLVLRSRSVFINEEVSAFLKKHKLELEMMVENGQIEILVIEE